MGKLHNIPTTHRMIQKTQATHRKSKLINPSESQRHIPNKFKPKPITEYNKYIISTSLGKDSTALSLWALQNLPREKLEFIYTDTGINHPIKEYKKYIEEKLHIKITTLKSNTDLFKTSLQLGLPNGGYRWCTERLKLWPQEKYYKQKGYYGNTKILNLTGERKEESTRRKQYYPFAYSKVLRTAVLRPILEWTTHQILTYLQKNNILLHPQYRYDTRLSCACCPEKTWKNQLQTSIHTPKLFKKLCQTERKLQRPLYPEVGYLDEAVKKYPPTIKTTNIPLSSIYGIS